MRYPARRTLSVAVVCCVLAGLAFTASGSAPVPSTAAASGTRVIMPGRPGEPARIGSSDWVRAPDGKAYTAADVWFVRMMIPHHEQAVEMASLAAQRAHNRQIASLAGRIQAAQRPEILQLRSWLTARGLGETGDDGTHDHTTMPGMQSPEAMRALAAAGGEQFDRMFVAMMTAHHQGAIDMAGLRLRAEEDVMIERMANEIAFEQAVEIDRMRDMAG